MIYLSKSEGVGGEIKKMPEDFKVMEITQNGIVIQLDRLYAPNDLKMKEDKESEFAVFVLQKKNWNTVQALIEIAKRLKRGKKSISYAGTKDRIAITVQLASIYGVKAEDLEKIKVKDININGAWQGEKVELGSNLGNAFEVRIRNCKRPENAQTIIEELGGKIPNYFGEQRFGMRKNNSRIGLSIVKGDLKKAVMDFLTDTSNEKDEEAISARKELEKTEDFENAYESFPKYLKPERAVLFHLLKYKNDYAGALRKLPRGILIMFVHALQAEIFNKELEERIKENDFKTEMYCKKNFYGFPDISQIGEEGDFPVINIIGYDTKAGNAYEEEIMKSMGISEENFKIKSMPEISMKGTYRPLFAPLKNLKHAYDEDADIIDLYFELPSGSYASVLLGELNKNNDQYE